MKVILDEMLPAGVAGLLVGHEVTTAKQAGFAGLVNGELIRRAATDGYQVLVTADRNLPAQQNIEASGIAIVLVRGSRMPDVVMQAARIRKAVTSAKPGTITRVEPG